MPSRTNPKNTGGRPAKFAEPSRPITVTLPERVLRLLQTVDSDRAKAIVKLVDSSLTRNGRALPAVSTIEIGSGKAVILVGHSEPLKRLPGLRLIEVAPARHLISIRPGTSIESLELAIHDLLEEQPQGQATDREILETLGRIIRKSRRAQSSAKEEILFVAPGH
jgi:hypothetical protein